MSWWRGPSASSRRAVTVLALTGAVSLTGAVAAAPAFAESFRQQEWHVNAMRLPEAWKYSKGQGVVVAVIDGGVDATRPDLVGQVLPGHDVTPSYKGTVDDESHGTGMAAMIAGTGKAFGGTGTIGVAPEAKILPLRVVDDPKAANQAESLPTYIPHVAEAIRYAADSKARIINISLAFAKTTPQLNSAVDYALSKGKLIFAGAGNSQQAGNPVLYPAGIPGVVAVAAFDEKGNPTSESESGPQVTLAAPGQDIFADCYGGSGFCKSHGTSDATALASGSAALLWAKHPDWTGNQVLRVLINTAGGPSNGAKRNDFIGYGAVRPRVALESPGDPGPADVSPLPAAARTAAPSAAATASGDPSSAPGSSPTSSASGDSGNGSLPWIIGGVVVVILLIGGAFALRRRGTR
jgi:type VII secretion-associated serine protease mycosin